MNDLLYFVYNEKNERHYFMNFEKAKEFFDKNDDVKKLYGKTKDLFYTTSLVMWK